MTTDERTADLEREVAKLEKEVDEMVVTENDLRAELAMVTKASDRLQGVVDEILDAIKNL